MSAKSYLLACVFLVALPLSAQGGEKYSVEDMVKFFAETDGHGVSRGLCVGSSCEPAAESKPDSGFNLNVNFEKDSAQLTDHSQAQLSVAAQAMNSAALADMKFAVDGHADASGTATHNMGLSERRAQSVLLFLRSAGVDLSRLIAKGYGESQPVSDDPYDPINRRVEARRIVE
jgi:outer membrane protein OmpA-like peptidoglycan-associated protein